MNRMNWTPVIGVGIVVLAVLLIGGGLLGGYGGWGMMGPGMMGGWGFGLPWIGGILMLAFWVLVIGGIVWVVQSLARDGGRPGTGTPNSETPLDVLKRRYAAGNITKEEFEAMKRDLDL